MEITEKEFKMVIKRAFVHGIVCSPFFEHILTRDEQEEKINEIIKDCKHHARLLMASQQAEPEIDFNMRSGKHCNEISLRKE